jgi:DNA-binding MarR family transcriptional regulator
VIEVEASPIKLQGCTNFKLRQLARIVTQDYDAELDGLGIKITQYSLLSHVLKLGPIRSVDLARAMSMDSSTLSRNLKPLIAEGWLALEAGADARSHLVGITKSGRQKRQEAQRHWHTAQTRLNKKLGERRVAALHSLLDEALVLLASDVSATTPL